MNKYYYFSLIFLILICCKSPLENKVAGVWVIDAYEGEFQLATNGLVLKKDNSCGLPMTYKNNHEYFKVSGKWEIISNSGKNYLLIHSANHPLCTKYQIVRLETVIDQHSYGNLLKMTLVSEKVKLECTRALN